MELENIRNESDFSFTSKMSFPILISTLEKMGVESYRVDLALQATCYYMADGEVMSESFQFEIDIAEDFNDGEIRAVIADSRHDSLDHKDFLKRLMNAGVSSYTIFIKGQKTLYYSRSGDCYVDNFPRKKLNQY